MSDVQPSFRPGPWNRFRPRRVEVPAPAVPPTPTPQVYAPRPGQTTPVPGPWNRFGRLRVVVPHHRSPRPADSAEPPDPPPSSGGVLGPPRASTPQVPRVPEATDHRERAHFDKVAGILNSLLRAGYLRLEGDNEYAVVGGGIALPRPPLATDDRTTGAVVGMVYVNTLDYSVYVNVSNAAGAAVWQQQAGGAGGGGITKTYP